MGRRQKFTGPELYRAVIITASKESPAAVTVKALSEEIGVPTGSIYYRFNSIADLLGEAWLSVVADFQDGFGARLRGQDTEEAGLLAALHTAHWSAAHRLEARTLLVFRREDFLASQWSPALQARARRLSSELRRALFAYAGRRFGKPTKHQLALLRFALIDMPIAAVKPALEAGRRPGAVAIEIIHRTYQSILEERK